MTAALFMGLFKGRPIFKGYKFTEYEMPIDLSGADPGWGHGSGPPWPGGCLQAF